MNSFILAIIIGLFFGIILEQAGLGSPKKLLAQFLFTDATVFKVMFTAIITCAYGLYFCNYFKIIDLATISFNYTYIWPQLIAGLIMGVGFVVGAYCPGTCLVGLASGKKDAIFFFLGMIFGTILFSLVFPLIENFYSLNEIKDDKLYTLFNISHELLLVYVSLLASAGFYFFELLEKKHVQKS